MANIRGTQDDDELTGTGQADDIRGLAGNDLIDGRGGADVLRGGAGDDTIRGGAGPDQLFGGAGFDLLEPGRGNDVVRGGTDFDRVSYENAAGPVRVDLAAGTADDGEGGSDTLASIEGVVDSPFDDTLRGNAEFNIFFARGGDDDINGRAGGNRIDYRDAPAGVDVDLGAGTAADGFGGNDTIRNINNVVGSAFDDVIVGNDDFNSFDGLAGDDQIDGGASGDLIDYQRSPAGVDVDLGAGTAADGFGGTDSLSNVDEVRGSAFDDILVGNDNFNNFEGLAGDDVIDGVDLINGNDVDYGRSPAGIVANLELGIVADGFGTTDTLTNIDGIRGSAFDDVMIGSSDPDSFETFQGRAGNDTIDGNGGGTNRLHYQNSPAGVVVNLAEGTAEDGFGTTDTFTDINAVDGSNFADTIIGSDGAFEFFRPHGGDDLVDGGAGIDRVDYRNNTTAVIVDLRAGTADDGLGGTDTLRNIEQARGGTADDQLLGDGGDNQLVGRAGADLLDGRGGNDLLAGEDGDDTLLGRGGDDFLIGGAGNDLLRGGAGGDIFFFEAADDGVDTIADLGAADVIDISELLEGFAGDPDGFVAMVDDGADAVLQVDPDGGGDALADLAVISGAAGTSVDDLIGAGNLFVGDGATG